MKTMSKTPPSGAPDHSKSKAPPSGAADHSKSSRWFVPLCAAGAGVIFFGAEAVGGDPGGGLVSLGIMVAFGALVLLGGRSETIRGLRGDGRDERFERMDVNATAFAGTIVILAIIVAFLVELAEGKNGAPYGWLGALAGLAYIAAVIVMRVRG